VTTPGNAITSSLTGQVALVTGGSTGIGGSTAALLAAHGASVVIAARRTDEGERAAASIRRAGGTALFVRSDVANSADVRHLVDSCIGEYGRLDIAFNNAGRDGDPSHDIVECDESVFDQTIAVNLKGVWLCMKYEIAAMLRTGGGCIVNCASAAGLRAGPGNSTYYARQFGAVGLTKAVSLEYAARGVRINAVCPGMIRTGMIESGFATNPGKLAILKGKHPIGRIGESEEVAAAVLWLCSPGAAFVTGIALPIDGGLSA
jgi:NAD(P)-dependent dehydrogenase (short-subunit alcohol dehydrogenase family)